MKRKNLVLINLFQCWAIQTNNMEELIFKTKKSDKVFLLLYLGISFLLISVAFYTYLVKDDLLVLLPIGIIVAMLLFLNFGSQNFFKIIIKENRLTIHFIFKLYSVDIKKYYQNKKRRNNVEWLSQVRNCY